MTPFLRAASVALLLFTHVPGTYGQDAPTPEQILANLRLRIPELRGRDLVMEQLTPSSIEGMRQATIVINGSQQVSLLIADETAEVYLLIAPVPIDVSLGVAEVEELLEQERQREAASEQDRFEALLEFSEGMASRGPVDAPVTIFEFSDFQCPFCASAMSTIDEILERYPEQVRFVYLHLPLAHHEWAKPAAIAAECAADQEEDAFWVLHDHYFLRQDQVTLDNLIASSKDALVGSAIDLEAWEACAGDQISADYLYIEAKINSTIEASEAQFGVSGTPAFFVNGRFLSGVQPIETFEALIEEFTAQ